MSARALGLSTFDVPAYDRYPDGSLEVICAQQMDVIDIGRAGVGDVLLFKWEELATHFGVLTSYDPVQGWFMTHAYIKNRKVVTHRLDAEWFSRVTGVYRVRGVEQ
jgi:hypothetical protein